MNKKEFKADFRHLHYLLLMLTKSMAQRQTDILSILTWNCSLKGPFLQHLNKTLQRNTFHIFQGKQREEAFGGLYLTDNMLCKDQNAYREIVKAVIICLTGFKKRTVVALCVAYI